MFILLGIQALLGGLFSFLAALLVVFAGWFAGLWSALGDVIFDWIDAILPGNLSTVAGAGWFRASVAFMSSVAFFIPIWTICGIIVTAFILSRSVALIRNTLRYVMGW